MRQSFGEIRQGKLIVSSLILKILADLIACDTQNPPRQIDAQGMVHQCLTKHLDAAFELKIEDYGKGRINWLAVRGNPCRLFNVHLDTVPIGAGWQRPALSLTEESGRAYGRGVCDIKGAAAALIAAGNQCEDVAILFSSDEEGAESCCVKEFCDSAAVQRFESFVVAEPTECRPVVGHRGYISVAGDFSGKSGHTSQAALLKDSANHKAARWVAQALNRVQAFETGQLHGDSACFNVGRIDGGLKNNVVADRCLVTWSARVPPGCSNQTLLEKLELVDSPDVSWRTTFNGPPLPEDCEQRKAASDWCRDFGWEPAADVEFWTEAALLAATGKPTMVLGPGHISQAHTADEWVEVEQLEKVCERYLTLMQRVE